MKIVTWNCKWGLTAEKARKVADWAGADVYFVQETNPSDRLINAKGEVVQLQHWYCDFVDSDWGISIFSNSYTAKRMNIHKGPEKFRYVVPYMMTKNDGSEKFVAFHVWTKEANGEGKASYADIAAEAMAYYVGKMGGLPFIVLGDFNYGSKVQPLAGLEEIDDANEATYKCIEKGARDYGKTYHNDVCFVSGGWAKKEILGIGAKDLFFYEGTSAMDKERSDHRPVMAELTLA